MKIKGSITIYLSMIMVSIILLVSVLSESARIQSIRAKSEVFTYMAADSIMAGYARQVYKDYGILLVWENQSVEEQLKSYIQANINMADLSDKGTNFMNTNLISVEIDKKGYVTDDNGNNFAKQIISYMKYSGTLKAVDKLTQDYKVYKKSDQSIKRKNMDVTYIVENANDELGTITNDIEESIIKLKDTNKIEKKLSAASQKLEILKKSVEMGSDSQGANTQTADKFLRKYRSLLTLIDMEAISVDETIILIKQYEAKKELFLKKNGYSSGGGGYIEDNLKILENVKNTIKEIKELDVSKFSDIDLKNINLAVNTLDKVKSIMYKLQSLKVYEVTEQDKKNNKIFESAKVFLESGILSLVIDDVSKISNLSISDSNLPTTLSGSNNNKSLLAEIKNKATVSLYADAKFGNYLKPRKETVLKYEMEYIVGGESSDRENLKSAVEKIALIRNAVNAAYLISDSKKMKEVQMIASSAAAVIGMPFLEPIFKVVLIEAWALAEAVSETRHLLKGGSISLKKDASNWKTSLFNLNNTSNELYEKEKGLDYQNYLQILIMLENGSDCIYRIMDLIQVDIQNKYNSEFAMRECFQNFTMQAEFETKQLFTAVPLVVNILNKNEGSYKYSVRCIKEY